MAAKNLLVISSGLPEECQAADTCKAANLPDMVGDSGAGGVKGAVPAPAAGDTAANKFLKANGTWVVAPQAGVDFYSIAAADAAFQSLDADLTAIAGLADPGVDSGLFWDESANAYKLHTYGSGLTMTGTVLTASGGQDEIARSSNTPTVDWTVPANTDAIVFHSLTLAAGIDITIPSGSSLNVTPLPSAPRDRLSRFVDAVISVTGAVAATLDRMHVVTGASAYTITLPSASGNAGRFVGFRGNQTAGVVITIDGSGSELLEDYYTTLPLLKGGMLTLYCDGTGWHIIDCGGGDLIVAVIIASGAASVDFTGYLVRPNATYMLDCTEVLPSVDGDELNLRVGAAGVYYSGVSDYAWSNRTDEDTADSEITMNDSAAGFGLSNAAGEFTHAHIVLENPAYTGTVERGVSFSTFSHRTGGAANWTVGYGYKTAVGALSDVQLLMSTGLISGKFVLRERRSA